MLKQFLLLISVVTTLAFPNTRAGSTYPYPGSTGGVYLHDKIGWGSCPDVKPAKDFNLTRIYGKWYTVAQYDDRDKQGQRCRTLEFSSGDEENLSAPCRVNVEFKYIDIKTGQSVTESPAFLFVAPENDQLPYTMKKTGGPSYNWYPIATDYDNYLANHRCEEFSGNVPFPFRFYKQYNYILHRSPKEIPEKDYDDITKFYNDLGISTEEFKVLKPDCTIKS